MTHTSPTTFVVWSTLSTALGAFLLGHLWRFDKFKCLRWSNTPYSGAFKRIMTHTYLITIPLIMAYSFGFTFIKYKEGFFDIGGTIMPKPYMFWSDEYRAAVFPLMMAFSFAWSFEMVTHLEELCFWYFLITAGPAQPDWFHSMYFRIWVGGSISALIYLPAVTISFRDNPLRCEARMFFSGSIGDLILTLGFIPILHRFPGFIQKVKAEGVDSSIVVRLIKFYELNVIRIISRFLMQLPLLALGIDGLKSHSHHLNESLFWTDLLSIIAALGCVFSSVCTLLIFFPRSYEAEYHAKEASHRRSGRSIASRQSYEPQPAYSQYSDDARNDFEPSPFGKCKSTTSISQKYLDTGLYEDDYVKYEQTERKMGTSSAKESFGSKLREGERRIARGTRRIGADLHHAFTGRLARLSRRRPRVDAEGNSGISWSLDMPSLTQEQQSIKERDTATRRTTPSARSTTHKRSYSTVSPSEDCVGASLKRKGTYLLTDSPVLRAGTANQREKEGRYHPPTASLETIEAVYETGAGGAALYDTARDLTSSPVGMHETELRCGDGIFAKPFNYRKDVSDSQEDGNIPALALDAPLSSTVPANSQASSLTDLPPNHTPATDAHIHGPRPIKKSMSVSTTATTVTRRALPTPPMTDPLGARPSHSITDDTLAKSVNSQKQGKKQEEDDNAVIDIRAGLRSHPFAAVSPLDMHDCESFIRPTDLHEPNEVLPPSEPPRSHMAQFGSDQARRVVRPPHSSRLATTASTRHRTFALHDPELGTATLSGGSMLNLTAANLSLLNSTTRRSQVNPLVRTFTSPIDFLDQIQENSGAGCGESGIGPNASQTQIGWAL